MRGLTYQSVKHTIAKADRRLRTRASRGEDEVVKVGVIVDQPVSMFRVTIPEVNVNL